MNIMVGISLVLIGLLLGHIITEEQFKYAAVERNYAEYNIKTGEWGWK